MFSNLFVKTSNNFGCTRKQWKEISFWIFPSMLRAPKGALALLVGDTPNPGKIRLRSFANTPNGVAFSLHFF